MATKKRDRKAEEIRRLNKELAQERKDHRSTGDSLRKQSQITAELGEKLNVAELRIDNDRDLVGKLARALGRAQGRMNAFPTRQELNEVGLENLPDEVSELIITKLGEAFAVEKFSDFGGL